MWYYTSVIRRQQVYVKAKLSCRGDMKMNFFCLSAPLGCGKTFYFVPYRTKKSLAFYFLEGW